MEEILGFVITADHDRRAWKAPLAVREFVESPHLAVTQRAVEGEQIGFRAKRLGVAADNNEVNLRPG
jgi:hypothetical protein